MIMTDHTIDGFRIDFELSAYRVQCTCGELLREPISTQEEAEAAQAAHRNAVAAARQAALATARLAGRRMTDAQARCLLGIRDHNDPSRGLSGMSAFGGLTATLGALHRRGYVEPTREGWEITELGKVALDSWAS
jgi:hypothetical protein